MTKATATPYKFVGSHVDDLADGRAAVPGQTYQLTSDQLADPHNKRLLDDGLLLEEQTKKESD